VYEKKERRNYYYGQGAKSGSAKNVRLAFWENSIKTEVLYTISLTFLALPK
jgi:hypothetical protein